MPSILQMRLVLDAPSADSEQMAFKSVDGQSTRLYVRKAPFLDETAVQSAAVAKDPSSGEPEIEITFTPQGRERLAQATCEMIHKRIAILIEGKLLDAPIIQAKISAATVAIHGHFTEAEATRLAEKINAAVNRKQAREPFRKFCTLTRNGDHFFTRKEASRQDVYPKASFAEGGAENRLLRSL